MKKLVLLSFSALILSACTEPQSGKPLPPKTEASTQEVAVNEVKQAVDKVVVTEFFDYACGHCRNAHFTVKNLKAKYGDQLEVTERHYPLSAATFLVAETAECAREQGKFTEYHNALIEENFGLYEPENLQKVATSVGLDLEAFNTCAANGAGKTRVQEDVNYAKALGVKGTPFFLINESLPIPGAVPEKSFDRLIQQVLNGELS